MTIFLGLGVLKKPSLKISFFWFSNSENVEVPLGTIKTPGTFFFLSSTSKHHCHVDNRGIWNAFQTNNSVSAVRLFFQAYLLANIQHAVMKRHPT